MKDLDNYVILFILYLHAGTDSAQPIIVVQDSYVKSWSNKMLAHILQNLGNQYRQDLMR